MPPPASGGDAVAWFAGRVARDLVEHVDVLARPARLRTPGWWALVSTFEGRVDAWRFAHVEEAPGDEQPPGSPRWVPPAGPWRGSFDEAAYRAAVGAVRARIRDGDVYQVNLCRVLGATTVDEPPARALGHVLARGNPAPFAGGLHVPVAAATRLGVPAAWVVTASPELYLRLDDGVLTSSPIKGTAVTAAGLTAKDRAENVMITDLVRNDLARVCEAGTVEVAELLAVEDHPGLVHLVSTVTGRVRDEVLAADDLWPRLLAATHPPGSVSGAPKSAALQVIGELEPVPRGPYCGAVGWVEVLDDGSVRAELAVGIRTFWWTPAAGARPGGMLRFGTGAGITWGSDPAGEWAETELKAARLMALASGHGPGARLPG